MTANCSAGARSYVAGSVRTKPMRGAAAKTLAAFSSTAAAMSTFDLMAFDPALFYLIPARGPLFRREHFEAGRPPAALDGLHELLRQLLRAHLRRERRVVVLDRNELHRCLRADRQHRVPDI